MIKHRTATVARKTKETDISVTVDLDGTGKSDIETGIGFFDHMLESFSKHSAIDLTVRCKGDLHIDMHHSVEDTGIVIGQAILKALGDFAGIFLREFGCFLSTPFDMRTYDALVRYADLQTFQ